LWDDRPFSEQAFFSVFHAVSAFCNAGFDLTGQSFVGLGARWQVWGVIAGLIIIGGLGFGTLYNIAHTATARLRRSPGPVNSWLPSVGDRIAPGRPARLTVTTRLVIAMTVLLLFAGTIWHFVYEATEGGTLDNAPFGQRLADSWFQSVTYRTAGFNSIDLSKLRPASLLFAIVLMFIGASPVSTGGGVKTVTVAVAWLAVAGILRGRTQTEAFGRSIPDEVVKRALTVIAIGVATLFFVALLLASFEDESHIPMIDLMYEAASACGTVGVTTGITSQLTPPSQIVLMCAMFLGRVGPLTLLLGVAGQRQSADYSYPDERVTLG
jgi:trk system potassium uptake protein TrkH